MASLNLSSNGPSITKSYQSVVNSTLPTSPQGSSPTYGQWVVYTVAAPLVSAFQQDSGKESVLKVQSTGEGELLDLVDEFSDGRIQFAFLKVKDPNTTLPKNVLIGWCGEGVPERTKGYFTSHLAAVSKLLHGYHVQVTARSDRDLTPEGIIQKVADASGAKYAGGPTSTSSTAPAPPIASKPAFMPTRVGGSGGFNPLGSKGRAAAPQDHNVDEDGWGADAPPVTRTQLEKVAPAYKPTKVNINELTSQKSEPSRFESAPATDSTPSDVVRGGYQPIGKVDIAAIRRQAKESGQSQDDRPTAVKGAYEPVGKVDIAAIKARAQAPAQASAPSPAHEQEEAPKSLAERSSAFTQSERLTSLPKPKVANKFGSTNTFTGTKAPSPGGFQGKSPVAAPQVGLASKTFADEGGKTPAQLWAEKKARERGNSGAALTTSSIPPALSSQPSGDSGFKSGYTGKSWAPVQTTRTGQSVASNNSQQNNAQDEAQDETPSAGVSSIRDRFKGGVPMGAPSPSHASDSSAPTPDLASKPNAGARGVPMPGLPIRPAQEQVPAEEHFDVPPPPRQPRSPTPETPDEMRSSSPIRIAQPVGRSAADTTIQAAEELHEPAPVPAASIARVIPPPRELSPEPQVQDEEPARAAAETVASTGFGAGAAGGSGAQSGGQRAVAQYDYEKAEDNELEMREGELIINIDMVDEDWWMGQNEKGETGLFPSNYVELVEDEEPAAAPAPAAAPTPAATKGPSAAAAPPSKQAPTATAIYDYDAAEENELSFPDGAKITDVEFPDEDWWFGHYGGKSGLFPSNYVQLNE